MSPFASYVICTSPRSGSTLLCKLLAATGVAGNPGSHFHEPSIDAWLGYHDLTRVDGEVERDTLGRIFRAAIDGGSRDTGMFGLRLQRHSFGFFVEKLAELHPEVTGDRRRIEAAFGPTLFIHLTRLDKVQQAVSYRKAEQSGLWHRAADGSELERLAPPGALGYDADGLRALFDRFTDYDRAWRDWFTSQGIVPMPITYEDLSADPLATLRAVLNELGVSPDAAKGVVPSVAKLADGTSADWTARFRAEQGIV